MRILMAVSQMTGIGGIQTFTRHLVKYLVEEGHEVDFITDDLMARVRLPRLDTLMFMLSLRAHTFLRGYYDVVHAHHHICAPALAGSRAGARVLSLHGKWVPQIKLAATKPRRMLFPKWYEARAMRSADLVTGVDKDTIEYYRSMTNKPIRLLTNSIDTASLPDGEFREYDKQVLYAGRLGEEKGIKELIEAAAMLPPQIHLIVVGDGAERRVVEDARQSNIHYKGPVSHDDAIRWMRGSDILIEPSIEAGGFGSTIMEAMAVGTAVMAHALPSNAEFLPTSVALTFDSHNAIPKLVEDLLNDGRARRRMEKMALQHIRSYDYKVVGAKLVHMYEDVLSILTNRDYA